MGVIIALFWGSTVWLLSDPNFTFKMCYKTPIWIIIIINWIVAIWIIINDRHDD